MRTFFLLTFEIVLLAGILGSCKKDPVSTIKPPDTTHHPCDTCHTPCDTCHHHCDTCHHPCDTCNQVHSDTTSHNFVWTEYNIPSERNLNGALVFGPNDMWTMGGDILHFDGNSWKPVPMKNQNGLSVGGLKGMFGFSSTDFWMVDGSIVYHAIGNGLVNEYRLVSLGIMDVSTDGSLHSCWGTSSSNMFFVGEKGTIVHFDGTTWVKFPKVTNNNLLSVWGRNSSDVWTAGYGFTTGYSELMHYDGSVWREISLSSIGNIGYGHHTLEDVWVTDSASHRVVLTSGSLLWRQTDEGSWRSDSGRIQNRLSGGLFLPLYYIRGNSANDLMTVSDGGFISHWNGATWRRYDQFYNPDNLLYITNGLDMKGNNALVIGAKDDQSWIVIGKR